MLMLLLISGHLELAHGSFICGMDNKSLLIVEGLCPLKGWLF